MGKTTLAHSVFDHLRLMFPEAAAASVDVGKDGNTSTALDTLLRGLGADNIQADKWAKLGQMRQVLQERKVLLLLDNLWTAEHFRHLLPLVPLEGSKVLVTTRDCSVLECESGWDALRFTMPVLDPEGAVALFRYRANIAKSPLSAELQVCFQ